MTPRTSLLHISLFLFGLGLSANAAPLAHKRGSAGGNPEKVQAIKASWFYNWGPRGQSRDGVQFVPMIKGPWHVTPRVLNNLKSLPKDVPLLGFNEPEREKQGNISVDQAIKLWPQLMATERRLGSPAPSSNLAGMQWLSAFMKQVEEKNYRVDFICVHWYRPGDDDDMEDWLKALHKKYDRPIWVTEYNGDTNDPRKVAKFVKETVRMLDKLSFVERYAYFSPSPGTPESLYARTKGEHLELSEAGLRYIGEKVWQDFR